MKSGRVKHSPASGKLRPHLASVSETSVALIVRVLDCPLPMRHSRLAHYAGKGTHLRFTNRTRFLEKKGRLGS